MRAIGEWSIAALRQPRFHHLAAVALGLTLGLLATRVSPLSILATAVAVLLAIVVARRADVAVLSILIATSTIFWESQLPILATPVGSLHLPDLILLFSLGIVVVQGLARGGSELRTPLDLPLLVFFGITLVSTAVALYTSSVDLELARRALRVVTYLLVFFVVTRRIREESQLRFLMRGLTVLALCVAGLMIVQSVVADSWTFLAGRVETLDTRGVDYSGVTRILTPGKALVFVAFVVGLARWVVVRSSTPSIGRLLQLGLLGVALVITFNRTYWIAIAATLLVLVVALRPREKLRLLWTGLAGLLLAVVASVLLIAAFPDTWAGRFADAALARTSTLLQSSTGNEESLRWRYVENEHALRQIRRHPFFGLGLGARYREFDARIDRRAADWTGWDPRYFIHNGHLGLAMHIGIFGYAAFFWLSARFLWRALRHWKEVPGPKARAAVLGFALAYAAALMSAFTTPLLLVWSWTPVLGLIMGVGEVLLATRVKPLPALEPLEPSGSTAHG